VLRAPLLSADYLFLRHRANKVGRLKKERKEKKRKGFSLFLFCLTCVFGESEKDKSVEKGQATGLYTLNQSEYTSAGNECTHTHWAFRAYKMVES
jgi:hypothetical protein